MSERSSSPNSAEKTQLALIEAALMLFGKNGFAAASTREIALAAKANIGSIAYHFGGKKGLYLACAEHVVGRIQAIAGGAVEEAMKAGPKSPEEILCGVVDRVMPFVAASREAGMIVEFVLRELQHPGEALDLIYSGVLGPVHERFCAIWAMATGEEAESEAVRLTIFTLIGQVVYFRIGRVAINRRMEWRETGPAEAQAIAESIKFNLRAMLAARREARS